MAPVEAASDGEMGYRTARSEIDSDASSHAGDGIEVAKLPEEPATQQPEIEVGTLGGTIRKKTSRDLPAPVTPIGKLPRIPSIEPLNTNPTPPPTAKPPPSKKPPIYEVNKDHLVGKTIDEWGDILDDDGAVLGRVEGDLPSMVGRKISNSRGDILGDDGELLGYVAEVGPEGNHQKFEEQQHDEDQHTAAPEHEVEQEDVDEEQEIPTRSLDEVMEAMATAGRGPGGLRVDPFGNILDADGNLVGSFHDKATGFGKRSGAFPETDCSDHPGESKPRTKSKSKSRPNEPPSNPTPVSDKPEGTATERRDKAQAQRKEENPLNPSDIFLDVKSTTEGIQLTIRIPTVFSGGGQPLKPRIIFE